LPHKIVNPAFPTQFANYDLFNTLRRGASGNELLRRALEQALPEFESRRVGDISITISPESSGPNCYLLAVTNTGHHTYEDLHVGYERLLLHAESFGLDTTHMPADMAWIAGEPVVIKALAPGKTACVVRNGYGSHEQFDGYRETVLDLEYRIGRKTVTTRDRRWSQAILDLPNAARF